MADTGITTLAVCAGISGLELGISLVMSEPKTVTVRFWDRIDKRWSTLEAELTSTPGLVIHRSLENENPHPQVWNVAHQRTGLVVLRVPSHAEARRAAKALWSVADWTLPRNQLFQCKSVDETVRRLRAEAWA